MGEPLQRSVGIAHPTAFRRPNPAARDSTHLEHYLAEMLAGLNDAMRVAGAVEGKDAVDNRMDAAGAKAVAEAAFEGTDDLGFLGDRACAQGRADDVQPLQQKRREVELGARPADQPDDDQSPVHRERSEIGCEASASLGVHHLGP